MEQTSYALVLTGTTLPGHDAEAVWQALAGYLRVDAAKLAQLRQRAPLIIKRGDDLGKLQTLQSGIVAAGAQAELCVPDGRSALFVVLDGAARGPLPRVFVDDQVEFGLWPDSVRVAEIGTKAWRSWRELNPREIATEPAPPPPPAPVVEPVTWTGMHPVVETGPAGPAALPPGNKAIYAGFWRRVAALMIDGLLFGIVSTAAQWAFIPGIFGAATEFDPASMLSTFLIAGLLSFIAQWLYFSLFESSSMQATPGKWAMHLKVVDAYGRRIGFGRASGRYFGKILSSLTLCCGYLMAGFTARKQALHDYVAATLVVFREVQPDRARPTIRPPMPWYGWVLNLILVCSLAALAIGFAVSLFVTQNLGDAVLKPGTGF